MYHATECIFDLIASEGPQNGKDMLKECRIQSTDPIFGAEVEKGPAMQAVAKAVSALVSAGIIISDDVGYYDLTDFGYFLL